MTDKEQDIQQPARAPLDQPMPSVANQPSPPRTSAGYAPLRKPGSVRRTSSIDVCWPEGHGGNMQLDARARDVVTSSDGDALTLLAEDCFVATLSADRTIHAIATHPSRSEAARLVGERGGGNLRIVLAKTLPEELRKGTPLYLLLDDISGTSLISGWAWSHWIPDWNEQVKKAKAEKNLTMAGVCIGFRPGSSALDPDSASRTLAEAPTPELTNPADPEGWHEMACQHAVSIRRARRIDIWLEKDVIHIDSAFQDSAPTPDGTRKVLHEYQLTAVADQASGEITRIEATPRVLPFPECTSAPSHLSKLIGAPLYTLREKVLADLSKTAGCTHLNDALRALAEVPILARHLR